MELCGPVQATVKTCRKVERGEELVYDYNCPLEGFETRPCNCGSVHCKGYIVGTTQWELHRMATLKKQQHKKIVESNAEEEITAENGNAVFVPPVAATTKDESEEETNKKSLRNKRARRRQKKRKQKSCGQQATAPLPDIKGPCQQLRV